MRKLVVISGLILGLLSGCTSNSANTLTTRCTYTDEIGDLYQETFVSKNNKVQTNDIVIERDYAPDIASGVLTMEKIVDEYDYRESTYKNVEGLTYSYLIDEAFVTEKVRFDYTTISFEYLAELGYLDSKDYEYIALDLTLNNLKSSGYTCDD